MLCSRSASLTSSTRMSSRQREQEFAQVLGGALILRLRLDLAKLGHAVDQPRDVGAEQLLDLLGGGDRVLDRVVEDRGDDRLVVELQVGEDAGDFDRVAEIGVARGADLGAMRLHREHIGAVDQRLVGVGIIGPDLLDQFILSQHGPNVGDRSALFASAKKGPAPARRGPARRAARVRRGSGSLIGACASARRRRRALAHCICRARRRQGAAVGDEALQASGLLGEVLAQDQRAAVVGRALAGIGAAGPADVRADDLRRAGGGDAAWRNRWRPTAGLAASAARRERRQMRVMATSDICVSG